jgi:hypothetical protein
MFNTVDGDGAVGAGAASRYGYGSDLKMRLRLRNTAFYDTFARSIVSTSLLNIYPRFFTALNNRRDGWSGSPNLRPKLALLVQ